MRFIKWNNAKTWHQIAVSVGGGHRTKCGAVISQYARGVEIKTKGVPNGKLCFKTGCQMLTQEYDKLIKEKVII